MTTDGAVSSLHQRLMALADDVQPLAASVPRLGAVIGSEDAEIETVCDVLREDLGLAAAVLRESNSSASAARDAITTIEAAVVRLGMARVLAVAVNQTVQSGLSAALPAYGLGDGILHRHSVAVSHVAEVLRPISSVDLGPKIVTCALLHDIGTIVLGQVLDRERLDAALSEHVSLVEAERALLEIDHAELGARLAALWKLPDPIVEGIRHHHESGESAGDIASAVAFADATTHELLADQLGWSEQLDEQVAAAAGTFLGVERGEFRALAEARLRRLGLLFDASDTDD